MSIVNMAKTIKIVHPESVVCYKSGSFYKIFGKDAYIISYLFGYQITQVQTVPTCGFPIGAINKVMSVLENKKIDYLFIDPRNNYDVDNKSENGNLNNYTKILNNASTYIKSSNRIDRIANSLKEDIGNENLIEKIRKIEQIVYEEGRKI